MPLLKQKLDQFQIDQLKNIIKDKEKTRNEVCRAQAILLLNDRTDTDKIEILTGYSRRQSFRLRFRYLGLGIEAIADKRKGKPKELLTKKQLGEIAKTIKEHNPKEFGYNSDFWTTGILGDFIERQYKIKYRSKTSYYIIFKQAKFTFHKPGRVYEKHNDQEIAEWKEKHEQQIFRAMDSPDTIVLAEDEMILSTQTTFQKIWLPQGEYPRVEISNTKKNRSIYGFLNIKTGQEHAFKTEWQNMFITVEILKKIRTIYPQKKLLIIWDGAGWHKGSKVQEFIKEDKNIETIHFPRYAPEVNPQEHVWKSGRGHCTHNKFIENIDVATDDFIEFLNSQKFQYSLIGLDAIL